MRISDWSSDVCSSDLLVHAERHVLHQRQVVDILHRDAADDALRQIGADRELALLVEALDLGRACTDRKSVVEGKSVSVRVDLGGRRNIKKTNTVSITIQNELRINILKIPT